MRYYELMSLSPWKEIQIRTHRRESSFSLGRSSMYCPARSTLTICFSVSAKDVTTPLSNEVIDKAYEMARPIKPGRTDKD